MGTGKPHLLQQLKTRCGSPRVKTSTGDTNLLTRTTHALRDLLQITNSEQDSLAFSIPTYKVKPVLDQFAHVMNPRV